MCFVQGLCELEVKLSAVTRVGTLGFCNHVATPSRSQTWCLEGWFLPFTRETHLFFQKTTYGRTFGLKNPLSPFGEFAFSLSQVNRRSLARCRHGASSTMTLAPYGSTRGAPHDERPPNGDTLAQLPSGLLPFFNLFFGNGSGSWVPL